MMILPGTDGPSVGDVVFYSQYTLRCEELEAIQSLPIM